jgi:hypothetical protein
VLLYFRELYGGGVHAASRVLVIICNYTVLHWVPFTFGIWNFFFSIFLAFGIPLCVPCACAPFFFVSLRPVLRGFRVSRFAFRVSRFAFRVSRALAPREASC